MARVPLIEKLGLLFALREEELGFERVMAESRSHSYKRGLMTRWRIGGVEVFTAVSGVGREHCAEMARSMVDAGVTSLICAGYAAALDPTAQVGDVLMADTILAHPNHAAPALCSSPMLMSIMPPRGSKGRRIRRCSLVTSDRVIISATEKNTIFRASGAAMLDMESYGAAEVCERREVPFLALRSISDRADQSLPREILTLLALPDVFSKALLVAGKPKLWLPLARLRGQAGTAADSLGDALGMMLLRLI